MMFTNYQDDEKRIYFVGTGLSGGIDWMTLRKKGTAKMGSHRVKSPNLPIRKTKEEAQNDLDKWAKEKGLATLSGVETEAAV